MLKKGIPLQKSVFMTAMTPAQARRLRLQLEKLIHWTEDDIRLYPLPGTPEIIQLGRSDLRSAGVYLK